jgi:hypothetical protein
MLASSRAGAFNEPIQHQPSTYNPASGMELDKRENPRPSAPAQGQGSDAGESYGDGSTGGDAVLMDGETMSDYVRARVD